MIALASKLVVVLVAAQGSRNFVPSDCLVARTQGLRPSSFLHIFFAPALICGMLLPTLHHEYLPRPYLLLGQFFSDGRQPFLENLSDRIFFFGS